MPDERTFRRRRAVFALLVALTLVLLTGSFVGAFGGAERGFAGVVAPIQDGASKVLKPARDLVNWFGDTFRAKREIAEVRRERDEFRTANTRLIGTLRTRAKDDELRELVAALSLDRYGPVEARVIGQPTSAWYRHVTISKGSSDGVSQGDPVIGPDGVVGTIMRVLSGSAVVRLVTDPRSGVKVRVSNADLVGVLEPADVGGVGTLELHIAKSRRLRVGEMIVTAGSSSEELPSLFPPDIPVARITRIEDADTDSQVVHAEAIADMRRLEVLRVLTAVDGDG